MPTLMSKFLRSSNFALLLGLYEENVVPVAYGDISRSHSYIELGDEDS